MRVRPNPSQGIGASDISQLKVRSQRLRELWEQDPDINEQQLIAKYREKHGEMLSMDQLCGVIRKIQKEASGIGISALKAHFEPVRTLIVEHPGKNTLQLTEEYNRRHHSSLSVRQVVRIVQEVDPTRWKRLAEDERVSRPRRLTEILDAHPEILYRELCAEYENRYDIKLVEAQVSQALLKLGIRRQDLKRGKEAEEFSKRPERLKALHQQHTHWTNHQLAVEYKRRYRVKLATRQVSDALLRAGIRRRRGKDADEVPQRPERLKALHRQHTDWTDVQFAVEYERIYHTKLKHPQISAALLKAGIRRRRFVEADELSQRPERLKALHRQYTVWTYDQLAVEYEKLHGIKLDTSEVSATLYQLGIRRQRAVDAEEFSKRPGRLKTLFKRHQDWTNDQLASEYARLYKIKLPGSQISQALIVAGIRRQNSRRPRDAEEFSQRSQRLKELVEQYPNFLYEKLADEYERLYHVKLAPNYVSGALIKLKIRRRQLRPIDAEELSKRPERLKELVQEYPRMTRSQFATKYEQLYHIKIAQSAVSVALKKSGYKRLYAG